MNEFEALQKAIKVWTCATCGHLYLEHLGKSKICVVAVGDEECRCRFVPKDQPLPNVWCQGPSIRILEPAKAQFAVRREIVMAEVSCPDHGPIGKVPLVGNEPHMPMMREIYHRHVATERFNRAQAASEAAALDLLKTHQRGIPDAEGPSDGQE